MTSLKLPAKIESLARLLAHVEHYAAVAGFSPERVEEIKLAVEEALINICRYAYPDEFGEVEVICLERNTGDFIIEIIDAGNEFNILALPAPDLTADIEHRQVGGLGVLLIRSIADMVSYRREEGRNILQLLIQSPSRKNDE